MDPDEITRIRALPLDAVLQSLGAERDPQDASRNWRFGASRITVTDARFYDHNAAGALHRMRNGRSGGGGAIDLVQYLRDIGFREAVRELGGLEASRAATAIRTPQSPDRTVPLDSRPPPVPTADRATRAEWYLTAMRGIPQPLVQEEMTSGRVFADARGNVVFRLRDEGGREIGYEVRGTYEKPYHSVHGQKGMFVSKADGARVAAFVESGIEALSYRALRGIGLIFSTTGSAIERPVTVARQLRARGYEVVTAFNADQAGDRLAQRMGEALGEPVRRDRPANQGIKDWNEQLKALSARRELPGQSPERRSADVPHAIASTRLER